MDPLSGLPEYDDYAEFRAQIEAETLRFQALAKAAKIRRADHEHRRQTEDNERTNRLVIDLTKRVLAKKLGVLQPGEADPTAELDAIMTLAKHFATRTKDASDT